MRKVINSPETLYGETHLVIELSGGKRPRFRTSCWIRHYSKLLYDLTIEDPWSVGGQLTEAGE